MSFFAKKIVLFFFAIAFAFFLSFLAGEIVCRVVFEKVDYLKPKLVVDKKLGYRIEPNSSGHDDWGYRNQDIPNQVDIVAIGDSQTYGVAASRNGSWPFQLQLVTGMSIYNLALGGYGPLQYLYVLKERGLSLAPSHVVVGFYLGNDLMDAWSTAYEYEYWENYRHPDYSGKNSSLVLERELMDGNVIGKEDSRILKWLSHNSMLWRRINYSMIGEMLHILKNRYRQNSDIHAENVIAFVNGVSVVFTPAVRMLALDLANSKIQEGMRITLQAILHIHEICEKHGIQLLVTLIPTKESVYGDYLAQHPDQKTRHLVQDLLVNEHLAREILDIHCQDHGIAFLDLLQPMKEMASTELIYPRHSNGHPNATGYRIIAESIAKKILDS